MALWCATTLDRSRIAKFNVNKAMILSSLLPLFISALEEIGRCSQLVLTIEGYHGQTAQVSAMNFSYNRICRLWALAYTFALGVLEGLITEGFISCGAFNRNTKKCFETSFRNADQNASLIFTVLLFPVFFVCLFVFFLFNYKTSWEIKFVSIQARGIYPRGLDWDVFFLLLFACRWAYWARGL